MKNNYIFLLLLLLLLNQIPFLGADPDTLVDVNTRGAWTDEGLYTSQIRNLVNHHAFKIKENTTFIRGPLFNIIQYPFFYIFGTKLIVCRLVTLISILIYLLAFIIYKENKHFILLLILSTLTEFHIFQFSHYALSELLCIGFILLSILFLIRFYKTEYYYLLFLSILFISFTYFTKIQFLYTILIPPLTIIITSFFHVNVPLLKRIKNILFAIVFTAILVFLYYLIVYLPNKEFYNYIMSNEVAEKFNFNLENIRNTFIYSFNNCIYTKQLIIFVYTLLIALPVGIFVLFNKRNDLKYTVVFIFSFIWTLLELHKLSYSYLPYRYLLSLIFAIGVFVSIVFSEIDSLKFKVSSLILVLFISWGVYNMGFNYKAYLRRTYDLEKVNNYLSKYNFAEQPIIGGWAASVTWKNKAITFPVWNKYLNYRNPIKTYHPKLIITETNESDCDRAFIEQNINLTNISDSVRVFNIWRYKLGLYWIK